MALQYPLITSLITLIVSCTAGRYANNPQPPTSTPTHKSTSNLTVNQTLTNQPKDLLRRNVLSTKGGARKQKQNKPLTSSAGDELLDQIWRESQQSKPDVINYYLTQDNNPETTLKLQKELVTIQNNDLSIIYWLPQQLNVRESQLNGEIKYAHFQTKAVLTDLILWSEVITADQIKKQAITDHTFKAVHSLSQLNDFRNIYTEFQAKSQHESDGYKRIYKRLQNAYKASKRNQHPIFDMNLCGEELCALFDFLMLSFQHITSQIVSKLETYTIGNITLNLIEKTSYAMHTLLPTFITAAKDLHCSPTNPSVKVSEQMLLTVATLRNICADISFVDHSLDVASNIYEWRSSTDSNHGTIAVSTSQITNYNIYVYQQFLNELLLSIGYNESSINYYIARLIKHRIVSNPKQQSRFEMIRFDAADILDADINSTELHLDPITINKPQKVVTIIEGYTDFGQEHFFLQFEMELIIQAQNRNDSSSFLVSYIPNKSATNVLSYHSISDQGFQAAMHFIHILHKSQVTTGEFLGGIFFLLSELHKVTFKQVYKQFTSLYHPRKLTKSHRSFFKLIRDISEVFHISNPKFVEKKMELLEKKKAAILEIQQNNNQIAMMFHFFDVLIRTLFSMQCNAFYDEFTRSVYAENCLSFNQNTILTIQEAEKSFNSSMYTLVTLLKTAPKSKRIQHICEDLTRIEYVLTNCVTTFRIGNLLYLQHNDVTITLFQDHVDGSFLTEVLQELNYDTLRCTALCTKYGAFTIVHTGGKTTAEGKILDVLLRHVDVETVYTVFSAFKYVIPLFYISLFFVLLFVINYIVQM